MKDIQFNEKTFLRFIKRYHLVLFSVITVLLLSVAVLLLSNIVTTASGDDAPVPDTTSSRFDQETIDRIKELKTPDQPIDSLDLSQGRINPFKE